MVPGAWHGPETWDQIVSILEEQEYKCVCVELPSTLSDPFSTYKQDVDAVRNSILAETTQGRDVVLVVHSYGGHVGSKMPISLLFSPEKIFPHLLFVVSMDFSILIFKR
jgi:hypothetical protein